MNEHRKSAFAYAELEMFVNAQSVMYKMRTAMRMKILEDLLPVIDSLVRAQGGTDNLQLRQCSRASNAIDLLETLARFGVEAIAPERGDDFNPSIHEAMTMIQDPT